MVIEKVVGFGSNLRGKTSEVISEYKLVDCEFVEVRGAEVVKQTKTKLVVSTRYTDSISFTVVVREDERVAMYRFTHLREVSDAVGKVPNQVEPTVKPTKSKHVYVEAPALREL